MINPLDLIARPQQPDYFNQLSMLGGNIAKQRQLQRQQAADARALAMFGADGIQPGMESQFLQEATQASPFVQGLANRQYGVEKGLTAYQQQQVDATARRQQLRIELNNIVSQMATADEAQMPALEALYEEKVTEHNTLPFTASHQLWRGSPTEVRQMQAAKEMRTQKEFEMGQRKDELGLRSGEQALQTQAADQWLQVNKPIVDMANTIDKVSSFIGQAAEGNPIAVKNLIAATSRMGSNEALSDGELKIMLAGDISSTTQAWINKMFGEGSQIGPQDVRNAIATFNSVLGRYKPQFEQAVGYGVKKYGLDRRDLVGQITMPEEYTGTVKNFSVATSEDKNTKAATEKVQREAEKWGENY